MDNNLRVRDGTLEMVAQTSPSIIPMLFALPLCVLALVYKMPAIPMVSRVLYRDDRLAEHTKLQS